jgi:hypothetical protein
MEMEVTFFFEIEFQNSKSRKIVDEYITASERGNGKY